MLFSPYAMTFVPRAQAEGRRVRYGSLLDPQHNDTTLSVLHGPCLAAIRVVQRGSASVPTTTRPIRPATSSRRGTDTTEHTGTGGAISEIRVTSASERSARVCACILNMVGGVFGIWRCADGQRAREPRSRCAHDAFVWMLEGVLPA